MPVATGGCEKVLLARADAEGRWPIPCFPEPLPGACERTDALCYANRSRADYDFAVAPGRETGKVRLDAVWPREAEPHVRRFYDAWDWRSLAITPPGLAVAQPAGVTVTSIGGSDRFILILRDIKPGATLRLTPGRRMSGVVVDAFSGRTISTEECSGSCAVSLPAGFRILLLAMR